MFHPEFRYLIERDAQDQAQAEDFVLFPQYFISGIVVVFINALLMLAFIYGIYEGIGLTVNTGYVIFVDFWKSLTYGCEWVEFIILITSGVICVILVIFMSIMADAWEKSSKMNNETEWKLKALKIKLENKDKEYADLFTKYNTLTKKYQRTKVLRKRINDLESELESKNNY